MSNYPPTKWLKDAGKYSFTILFAKDALTKSGREAKRIMMKNAEGECFCATFTTGIKQADDLLDELIRKSGADGFSDLQGKKIRGVLELSETGFLNLTAVYAVKGEK